MDTAAANAPAGVVDPMQWWGALTQQFTQLAVQAMKDGTTDAAKSFAGAVAKQSIDVAGRHAEEGRIGAERPLRKARCARPPPRPGHRRGATQGALTCR